MNKPKTNPEERALLQACADEIGASLRKYDLAGVFSLAARDTATFMFRVSPSWSCISLQARPGGGGRLKVAMESDDEAEKQRAQDSVQVVMNLLSGARVNVEELTKLVTALGKIGLQIEHVAERLPEPGRPSGYVSPDW